MSLPLEYDDEPGAVQAARKTIGRNDFRYRDVTIVRVGRRVTFSLLVGVFT
jgi:hypothetical protein